MTLENTSSEVALSLNSGSESKIPGVKWNLKSKKIDEKISNGEIQYSTVIQARVEGTRVTTLVLVVDELPPKKIAVKNNKIELKVILNKPEQVIHAYADFDQYYVQTDVLELKSDLHAQAHSDWGFDLGASLTFLNYHETYGNAEFKIQEMGVTVKTGVSYSLSSDFDLGASAFGTAIPFTLSRSPNGIETSRFYGLNGRLNYHLLNFSAHDHLTLGVGWYVWGQIVPGSIGVNTYGVSNLNGPQAILSFQSITQSARHWYSYFKFAEISSSHTTAANRELSIGYGYQLSDPLKPGVWMFTTDLAEAQYTGLGVSGLTQHLELFSLSLGLSRHF